MRVISLMIGAAALGAVGVAAAIRLLPLEAEIWHVEPGDVTPPSSPNYVWAVGENAPQVAMPLGEVAARIETAAAADGATLLAGNITEGHASYVARSQVMGFPDVISLRLRAVETEEGDVTALEIFSRARFGYSDLSVNRDRLLRWLPELAGQI